MVTVLLIVIYLVFIGLGLPDALLGSAWSIMKFDIGAATEMAGYISLTVSFCTVVSSLFASRLLHRFGTGKVTLFSILSTTIALLWCQKRGDLCQSTRTAKTLKTRGKTDLYTYVQNTSFVNMYIEKRITARFSSRVQ